MSGSPTSSTTRRGRWVLTASRPASPVDALQHPVALAGEVELDEVGDVGFVVDDEDRSSFHDAMVARRTPAV